jgi:hypothetical protein
MLCPLSVQPWGVGLLDGGSHGWCGLVVSSGGESDSYVVIIVSNEGRRQHYDGCCKLVVLSPGERDIVDFPLILLHLSYPGLIISSCGAELT